MRKKRDAYFFAERVFTPLSPLPFLRLLLFLAAMDVPLIPRVSAMASL
jgi:hypothetical protein